MKDNSDSKLLQKFKEGDKAAANELIQRYFDRVTAAAKRRLEGVKVRISSEDDIAASVFESLWRKADEKTFGEDDLASSDELWRLLCIMTRNKARDHARREYSQKRGGGMLRGGSIFENANQESSDLSEFAVDQVSVAELVGFRDQHRIMMEKLEDDTLREVATLRLEGYQVREISEHFDKSERWVKRKLALIREVWVDYADKYEDE